METGYIEREGRVAGWDRRAGLEKSGEEGARGAGMEHGGGEDSKEEGWAQGGEGKEG